MSSLAHYNLRLVSYLFVQLDFRSIKIMEQKIYQTHTHTHTWILRSPFFFFFLFLLLFLENTSLFHIHRLHFLGLWAIGWLGGDETYRLGKNAGIGSSEGFLFIYSGSMMDGPGLDDGVS